MPVATIRFEDGQRSSARLRTISVTGGLLQVLKPLSPGTVVELMFSTHRGPVLTMAELLGPCSATPIGLQPFRFVDIDDTDLRKLRAAIASSWKMEARSPSAFPPGTLLAGRFVADSETNPGRFTHVRRMKLRLGFLSFAALTLSALALTLGLSLQPTVAHAGDLGVDKSRLLALENSRNLAQLQRDSKGLQSLLPESFVYTDYDGRVMKKAQFLEDNKDPAYNATLVTNNNMQVFSYPNVAIVIGNYHTKGTYRSKAFDHRGRFTDTWLYENNTWQCIASHTNLFTTKQIKGQTSPGD
jgi:hypothetical protein